MFYLKWRWRDRLNRSVGASSLLTVFASLCLIIFSLLALATAQADERISIASAQAAADYYAAECKAQEVLLELREGRQPLGVLEADGVYSYECFISEKRCLHVEVMVEGSDYKILRWQVKGEQP